MQESVATCCMLTMNPTQNLNSYQPWQIKVAIGLSPFQLTDFAVDKEAVPEALVEVPLPAWHSIEEAAFREVTDAEAGEGAGMSKNKKPRPNERSRLLGIVVSNLL